MRTFLSPLFFLFVLIAPAAAEKITGQVVQPNGTPVEYATVMLYSAADSALVKGGITDTEGRYEFENIPAGRYFISASQLGLGQGATPVFEYAGGDKAVEKLQLTESAQEIGGVTIEARRPMIEVQADKTVLNVEGNINSQGQNALELLRKAPGVMVDNNDNIILKGKNAVRIQIDGRDVPMQNKDIAALLKTMRAEDIAALEMITNPSAKYDASGNAGIINIRTRKNRNIGANGTIGGEAIYGQSLKGGARGSFNYRNEKFNLFANYNNHFGDWHNEMSLLRDQNGMRFDQHSDMKDNNNNHGGKLGADFFLNDKHTIGFLVDGRRAYGPWHNEARTLISSLENPSAIDSILLASNQVPQTRLNGNVNLNYRFADTSGRELNIDVNRGLYRYRADSYQPNYYLDPTEQTILSQKIYTNNTPTDVNMVIAKIDYEQPLWKGKIGLGVKTTNVKTDNNFEYFDVIDGTPTFNVDRSNRFVYDEHVNAGYLNYNLKVKKWSFQGGVRAEHTAYTGDLTSQKPGQDTNIENDYLNFFPSAAATYEVNPKNQLSLSYSRRIDRPRYQDLNPFEDRLDELAYKAGNPFLRPQFTNSLELTHTFGGMINTTLGFSRTDDMFTEYIDTTEGNKSFLKQANIATQDNLSLSIGMPIPIAKWWEAYVNVTGFMSSFEAEFRPGFVVSESYQAFNAFSEHTFRLSKGWSFQLSGWFNSPAIWGAVFRSKAQGAVDVGVKKQILDGDGTISLSVGDVFRTAGWRSVNDFTPGLYMTGRGRWESQTARLNVSYNFGNKNIKAARQRKTGLEDINQRIGGGRN